MVKEVIIAIDIFYRFIIVKRLVSPTAKFSLSLWADVCDRVLNFQTKLRKI